jgi:hypothetical protein
MPETADPSTTVGKSGPPPVGMTITIEAAMRHPWSSAPIILLVIQRSKSSEHDKRFVGLKAASPTKKELGRHT